MSDTCLPDLETIDRVVRPLLTFETRNDSVYDTLRPALAWVLSNSTPPYKAVSLKEFDWESDALLRLNLEAFDGSSKSALFEGDDSTLGVELFCLFESNDFDLCESFKADFGCRTLIFAMDFSSLRLLPTITDCGRFVLALLFILNMVASFRDLVCGAFLRFALPFHP